MDQKHFGVQALHNNDLLCNFDTQSLLPTASHWRMFPLDIFLVRLWQQDSNVPQGKALNLGFHLEWLIQHYGGRSTQHYTLHLQLLHFHAHRIYQNHKDDNLRKESTSSFFNCCLSFNKCSYLVWGYVDYDNDQ